MPPPLDRPGFRPCSQLESWAVGGAWVSDRLDKKRDRGTEGWRIDRWVGAGGRSGGRTDTGERMDERLKGRSGRRGWRVGAHTGPGPVGGGRWWAVWGQVSGAEWPCP